MSDHHPRDPLDDAYVEAERLLEDDAARRARRAQVLAAVATTPADAPPAPVRRTSRWTSGWALAAGIGGLGVLVAIFVSRSLPPGPGPSISTTRDAGVPIAASPPASVTATSSASPSGAETTSTAPPVSFPAPALRAERPATARAAPPPPTDVPPPPPLPLPPTPKPVPQTEAPPAPVPSHEDTAQNSQTAEYGSEARAGLVARDDQAAVALRRAAAAGRTEEVEVALSRGAPVDAPDVNGDTALILSVRGAHTATAALLRSHGADPERKNLAGMSATALASGSGDAKLEDAVRRPRQ